MQIAYIKFNSREDQVRGFYELATRAHVTSLPGGVYAVPWKALALLDAEHLSYRRATDAAGRCPSRSPVGACADKHGTLDHEGPGAREPTCGQGHMALDRLIEEEVGWLIEGLRSKIIAHCADVRKAVRLCHGRQGKAVRLCHGRQGKAVCLCHGRQESDTMAYSDFTNLGDLESQFGITILSAAPLFRDAKAVQASEQIRHLLEENVSLALNINTEKARSEFIIAPVLLEVRQLLDKKVSLFSGIDFTVDVSRGLNGYCDFLLSYSPDQVFLRAPVACIVEAKNENIKSGYPQCIAEMIAARLFNERQRHAVNYILGIVTTGSNWKFLKLQDDHVLIDFDEYLISQAEKILGIFVEALQQISQAVAEHAPAAPPSHGAP